MHGHLEIKVNGQWHHYQKIRVYRDYELFGRLAGVRRHSIEDSIAGERGVPDDATFTTKFEYEIKWGSDAHSPSWISDKECLQLESLFGEFKVWKIIEHYLFGNYITSPLKYPEEYERFFDAGFTESRIVFWFDS